MTNQSRINLLPAEQVLREFLIECSHHFSDLEIWITGGWVRDRLLGIPSSDLDFALSNITGKEFGKFVEEFSAKPEVKMVYAQKASKFNISGPLFTQLHITKRNAATAKKLETAGGRLFGLDVDFVNLRKEVYDGQSRNPDMEFGTAEEDAFRRDATINALFFHLGRQEVVDFTGKGIKDLTARIVRTPLDPKQTFMDDPLRVLRLIRVASKLEFSVEAKTASCMQDSEVHKALDRMITRDRIGAELGKIMTDKNTETGFRLIFESGLYSPIFLRRSSVLLQEATTRRALARWPTAYGIPAHLLQTDSSLSKLLAMEENRQVLWTLAAYTPLAQLRDTARQEIVREATSAIKLTAKLTQLLEDSLKNFDAIRDFVRRIGPDENTDCLRSKCGMTIRSWGTTWRSQLVYVMLSDALDCQEPNIDSTAVSEISTTLLTKYSTFADVVCEQRLEDAALHRPPLNGIEIQKLFGLGGGKYLKVVTDKLIEWHFDHADATKEECETWLLRNRLSLGVSND